MTDINDDPALEDENRLVEKMDEVRSDLDGDINRLGEQMQHLTDWRAYVRSAPLTSVGLAAAVGYLLAPRLISGSAPGRATGGLMGMLVNIAMAAASQAASVYLADLLTQQLNRPPDVDSPPSTESTLDPGY